MTGPSLPPRLPVGQAQAVSFQGILRRVTRPDQPRVRKVLDVAWPVVLTNLLASLALTVDLAFVGRLGTTALAATGVATQAFFIAMTLGVGISAGATAVVARAIGAGDRDAANRAATSALLVSLVAAAPLTALAILLDEPLLRLMGADAGVLEQGALVLRLLAPGIIGNLFIQAAAGALTGAGDTRPGLVIGLLVNVVNVVLDYALIFGKLGAPALGLGGAAIATTLSFTVGGAAFLVLLARGRRPVALRRAWGGLRADGGRVLRVGAPTAVENLLLTIGFTVYLVMILRFGADALAAHQIGLRAQSLAFMPGFGFAAAASALVGQGLGRGAPEEAEASGWTAITVGLGVMVALSLVMFALARPIAGLFTTAPVALALGVDWIHALVVAMPAIALHFTAAGALRGAGDTRFPLLVSFGGLWLLRLPLAWFFAVTLGWGMYGIWTAYVVEYYARAVVTLVRFARGRWKALAV